MLLFLQFPFYMELNEKLIFIQFKEQGRIAAHVVKYRVNGKGKFVLYLTPFLFIYSKDHRINRYSFFEFHFTADIVILLILLNHIQLRKVIRFGMD